MGERIQIGDIVIAMTRKDIKHVYLSVHPPLGRVSLVAPTKTRRRSREHTLSRRSAGSGSSERNCKARHGRLPRRFIERESHYLWGRRYLLSVVEEDTKPSVRLTHRRITLAVRPGSTLARRDEVMREWHRSLLHEVVPALIRKWEAKLGVTVSGYFLQRMKTKWGSCNHGAGNIRLNTELVKKPKDLLEYVVVHEMVHLVERTHSERFVALLSKHYPAWREARAELNELPLGAEEWVEHKRRSSGAWI